MGKKSTPTRQDIEIGRRIIDMRKRMGYTQADLAKKMQVTTPTISGYETGQADPKTDGLIQLARILSCSTDYLLGLTDNPNPVSGSPISDEDFSIAWRIHSLDPRGRGVVLQILDYEEKYMKRAAEAVPIRVYPSAASAGTGNYLDGDFYEVMDVPADAVPSGTEYGVRISGDSMEPDIPDGSIAFVQPVQKISSGEIGIFVLNGESCCRMLLLEEGTVRLRAINHGCQDILIQPSDSLYTTGRVLGNWKP